ncbi:MAG: transporter [Halioglobus sp.]|nr:transporter [Halioglobus sp.]
MNTMELPIPSRKSLAFGIAISLGAIDPLLAAEVSNAELLQQIKDRDAVINELLQRVDALERQASGNSAPRAPASEPRPYPGQAPVASDDSPPGTTVAWAQPEQPAPGTVVVDERAADRALERTLTIEGALLLPKGVIEVAPYTDYTRRDAEFPILLGFEDFTTVGFERVKRDEFTSGLRGGIGLPFASQFEFDIPYRYVKENHLRTFNGFPVDNSSEHGDSIGDIRIGIAKTLLRQEGWKPDLLARFTWDTDTGDSVNNGIPLGSGFDDFRFSFTGLKRQDPLAFTATVSYQHSLEKNDLQPGDEFGLSLGTSMASSPSTSLSVALVQSFRDDFKIDGSRVDGTSANTAQLLFGASSVLGRHTLLAVSAGVGLTEDSPDYTVNISLPVRFWW